MNASLEAHSWGPEVIDDYTYIHGIPTPIYDQPSAWLSICKYNWNCTTEFLQLWLLLEKAVDNLIFPPRKRTHGMCSSQISTSHHGGSPWKTPMDRYPFHLADRWRGKFYSTTNRFNMSMKMLLSDEAQPQLFCCGSQASRSVSCVANVDPIVEILGNACPKWIVDVHVDGVCKLIYPHGWW